MKRLQLCHVHAPTPPPVGWVTSGMLCVGLGWLCAHGASLRAAPLLCAHSCRRLFIAALRLMMGQPTRDRIRRCLTRVYALPRMKQALARALGSLMRPRERSGAAISHFLCSGYFFLGGTAYQKNKRDFHFATFVLYFILQVLHEVPSHSQSNTSDR